MSKTLFDYEVQYVCDTITELFLCESYEETFHKLTSRITNLFNYDVSYITSLKKESKNIQSVDFVDCDQNSSQDLINDCKKGVANLNLNLPNWQYTIAKSSSDIKRQSDYVSLENWQENPIYKKCWEPYNIAYALNVSLVHNRQPFANIAFVRSKFKNDFSSRDVLIMENLKYALEIIFAHFLLSNGMPTLSRSDFGEESSFPLQYAEYDLTHREMEITQKVCEDWSTNEICDSLHISPSTLNKHLSNIFRKTGTENRRQLYFKFKDL